MVETGIKGCRLGTGAAAALVLGLLLAACQTPGSAPPSDQAAGAPARPAQEVDQGAPTEAQTREMRAQAAKQAFEAMDLLQNGDEAAAKTLLDHVLQVDPGNDLARKLMDQIKADAQQELGSVYFRYTVRPEDSLSKLAQRFLNDRYRFYILAKYNDLRIPNKLEVGQVIKIPGKEPPPVPALPAAKPSGPQSSPVPPAQPAPRAPEPAVTVKPEDTSLTIKRLTREAEVCYQRDRDLDCAIAKWNRVLELDPDNQLIRLKRERAIALKEKLRHEGK